jgi:predicted dithiol-disulfide oxidoreductase (DUF899 family)
LIKEELSTGYTEKLIAAFAHLKNRDGRWASCARGSSRSLAKDERVWKLALVASGETSEFAIHVASNERVYGSSSYQ